ncbi:MAG: hypothetical protein AAGU14_06910 [Eubacteriaceae bacterium]
MNIRRNNSTKAKIIYSAAVIAAGLLLGYIAKATDSVNIIGDITTEFGIWVFLSALASVYSSKPIYAAINVTLFFLAMLCSYYIYGQLVLGFFPKAYFLGWRTAAFMSSAYGAVVWFSKEKGIISIIAGSIPVSVLFALGYPAFYTQKITLYVTLAFGVILNIILPSNKKQKIIVFICSVIFAFIICKFNILNYLPF